MNLITIGSDRTLFEEGSDVARRASEQSGSLQSHLIIVFAKRSLNLLPKTIGEKVRVIPTNSRSRFHYLFDAMRIGREEGKGANLITTQDPFEAGLVGVYLKKRLSVALQIQVHADIFSPYFKSSSLLNRLRVLLASFVLPQADCIRVVSERIRQSIAIRFPTARVAVVPVFPRRHDASSGALPPSPYLLVVSRLEKEKSVDTAIRAFALIASRNNNVILAIAGSGREADRLKRRVQRLNIESRVVFLGLRRDVDLLMRSATAILHVSPSEGYGLALLEAARAGCPIISTDVGLIGDVIPREDIMLVPTGDIAGTARGVMSVLENLEGAAEKAKRLKTRLAEKPPQSLDEYLRTLSDTWAQCAQHESR